MEKEMKVNVPPPSLLTKVIEDFGVGDYDYILFKTMNEGYEVINHEPTGRGERCTTKILYSSDMKTLSETNIEVDVKSIHVDQEPESREKLLLEIARKVAKEFSGACVKQEVSGISIGSKILVFDHEIEEPEDLFDFYLEIEGWVSSLILACAKMSGYTKMDEKEMEKIQNEMGKDEMEREMVDAIDEMEREMEREMVDEIDEIEREMTIAWNSSMTEIYISTDDWVIIWNSLENKNWKYALSKVSELTGLDVNWGQYEPENERAVLGVGGSDIRRGKRRGVGFSSEEDIKYLLCTDIGQDWDDQGMIELAIQKQIRNAFVLCLSGDTPTRAKLVEQTIFAVAGKDSEYTVIQDNINFKYNGIHFNWRIFIGESTEDSSFEVNYGKDLLDTSPIIPSSWNSIKRLPANRWGVLLAGPPCGARICDIPGEIVSTIFVGDDPRGKSDRGINGGANLSAKYQKEIDINLNELDSISTLTFIPAKVSRDIFTTTEDLKSFSPFTQNTLLAFTSKFLLGKRPSHLKDSLQARIATSNAKSIMQLSRSIIEDISLDTTAFLSQANRYAEKFPALSPENKRILVNETAKIFAYGAYIRGYSTSNDDVDALNNFLQKATKPAKLLPAYDMTGLNYLIESLQ